MLSAPQPDLTSRVLRHERDLEITDSRAQALTYMRAYAGDSGDEVLMDAFLESAETSRAVAVSYDDPAWTTAAATPTGARS